MEPYVRERDRPSSVRPAIFFTVQMSLIFSALQRHEDPLFDWDLVQWSTYTPGYAPRRRGRTSSAWQVYPLPAGYGPAGWGLRSAGSVHRLPAFPEYYPDYTGTCATILDNSSFSFYESVTVHRPSNIHSCWSLPAQRIRFSVDRIHCFESRFCQVPLSSSTVDV